MTVIKNQRNWYNQLAVLVVPIQTGPDGSKPFVNVKGSNTAIVGTSWQVSLHSRPKGYQFLGDPQSWYVGPQAHIHVGGVH